MSVNSTKLGTFCDSVIEVGWLAAVVVIPLLFNAHSSRIFEPEKVAILRTIALVMVALWLVKFIEERASGGGSVGYSWRTPLALPTLCTVVVYLVSTLLSVTPRVSLLGSYARSQGTFTTFSYIVVFLMILQGMRTRAQLDRLLTFIIVSSLPVALYGVLQRLGLDPFPWKNVGRRVSGTMGNPIFLAAYLTMVFPLTIGRAVECLSAILARLDKREWPASRAYKIDILHMVGYALIAAAQLITTWYAQSRGPLLALVAGVFFFLLLVALALRGKWGAVLVVMTVALTAFVVISMVLVSAAGGGLQYLKSAPWLGRLGDIFSFTRILYWQGMVDLVLPHDPIPYPDGHTDRFNTIRPLVGYGPESIRVVYSRFRLPLHWRYEAGVVDRAHNETFDALATMGLLGLIAYLFLFLSVFYYGFKWLGLLKGKGQRRQLVGLVFVCCLAGLAFSWLQVGPHFFGIALALGIVAGLAIYLSTAALVFAIRALISRETTPAAPHTYQILILSLLSSVVTHFVEINVGIAVTVTRTTFWICTALLTVAGLNLIQASSREAVGTITQPTAQTTERQRKKRRRRRDTPLVSPPEAASPGWLWSTLGNSMVSGLILGTLAFDFVVNLEKSNHPGRVIWQALTSLYAQGGRTSYGVLAIMLLTWLLAGFFFLSEMTKRGMFDRRASDRLSASLLYLIVSLGLCFAFTLLLAGRLATPVDTPSESQSIETALSFGNRLASRMTLYCGFVAFVLLAGGLAMMRRHTPPRVGATARGVVAFVSLLVVSGTLAVQHNLAPIQADTFHRQAGRYDKEGAWDLVIAHYERAIELASHESVYYLELGRAYSQKAAALGDGLAQQERLLQLSEQSLIQARDLNPLEREHSINLAGLYRQWYNLASDPVQKVHWGRQASANYEIATMLSPHDAVSWNTLGDFYLQLDQLEEAAQAYERVVELAPHSTEAWRVLGSTYAQLGRLEEAVAAMHQALELEPEAQNAWNTHLILAVLDSQLGRPEEALSHAQMAWQLAPEEEKPALQDMIVQLEQEQ